MKSLFVRELLEIYRFQDSCFLFPKLVSADCLYSLCTTNPSLGATILNQSLSSFPIQIETCDDLVTAPSAAIQPRINPIR